MVKWFSSKTKSIIMLLATLAIYLETFYVKDAAEVILIFCLLFV